jgi:hypothetical protein
LTKLPDNDQLLIITMAVAAGLLVGTLAVVSWWWG